MLENHGFLQKGLSVTVILSANPFSMNIGKRFWAMDDTDINRMFPGYHLGETTQQLAYLKNCKAMNMEFRWLLFICLENLSLM